MPTTNKTTSQFVFLFEYGERRTIYGRHWGSIMGQALFLARTLGRIVRYD